MDRRLAAGRPHTPDRCARPPTCTGDLRAVRERGYAVDDQENEPGVNCLALPVYATSPTTPSGAVSVSALAYRTPLHTLVDAVDEIRELLGPLARPHR